MAINRRTRFRIFVRDNFTCAYCGRRAPSVTLEVDHKHPRSKGGSDDDANLVTACLDCNRGKFNTVIRTTWTLVRGPLDGTTVRRLDDAPIEWVWRCAGGDLITIPDAVVEARRPSDVLPLPRWVFGPNLFNHPIQTAVEYHTRIRELLGAYVSYGSHPAITGPTDSEMYWSTSTDILLEFDRTRRWPEGIRG